MKKILFVEDDPVMHKLVKGALGKEFDVLSTFSVGEATLELDKHSDLMAVLIDRSLPDGDGLTLCTLLKQHPLHAALPVVFLTSAGSETDKVTAFFAGADDYITKPFSLLELKARINARVKSITRKIRIDKLELDLDTHRVVLLSENRSTEIDLTRTEFKILVALSQHIDQVFHRERLLAKVWGSDCHVSDRVVDSHISHLRKKLSTSGIAIESLRGEGYRLAIEDQQKAKVS